MIELPYGGSFEENALVQHIKASGRNYIIQGQQAVSLNDHTKKNCLDYWIRKNAKGANPDTKQATDAVMRSLLDTRLFALQHKLKCPDSGRLCRGLVLI